MKFLKEVKAEFMKVTWPSRETALMYTALVISISVFVAYYMFIFDYLFLKYGIGKFIQ